MKSLKTTIAGVCGLVVAVAFAVKAFVIGMPDDTPNVGDAIAAAQQIDWNALYVALVAVFPSVAALFARDNDKTSEAVGAK